MATKSMSLLQLVLLGWAVASLQIGCANRALQRTMGMDAGSSEGVGTPEEVVEATIAAYNAGDAVALGKIFPSDALLGGIANCESGYGPFEGVRTERSRLTLLVANSEENISLEAERLEKSSDQVTRFFRTTNSEGCDVSADVEAVRFEANFMETLEGGKPTSERQNVLLLRTARGWFLGGVEARVTAWVRRDE